MNKHRFILSILSDCRSSLRHINANQRIVTSTLLLPNIIESSRHGYIKDAAITLVLATRLSVLEVFHNICNMGTHDLPDMYALSPRRQITRAHVTTIKYTYREGEYPTLYCPIKMHCVLMLHHTRILQYNFSKLQQLASLRKTC